MCAAFPGYHPGQPLVHLPSIDEGAGAAAGKKFAKCRILQLIGVHSLAQQVVPLLQDRTQTRVAPSLDQCSREGVLLVGQ